MENKRKKLSLILVIAGLAVSGYLTHAKLNADPFACVFGQCSIVQDSSYATLFGVPVAGWGFLYYLGVGVFLVKTNKKILDYLLAWGVAFSLYLTYIEIFVLRAICGWCVLSFVIIILLSLLHYDLFGSRSRRVRT